MLDRFNTPLIHKNKRRARILLYLVPALLALATVGAVLASRMLKFKGEDWIRVHYEDMESVRLFREYLRIDTAYPTGNEISGAEFLARELRRAGLEPHVERIGHRNANVWAVLEGEDPRAVVLHNHIDVDPISHLQKWLYPPFSPTIDLPYVSGRGSFDMKSVAIAQLMAIKDLAGRPEPPRRSVVFLATGDEERGSRLGARWFLREHPELVERFSLLLTEGGAVEATAADDVKFWGTEVTQKRFVVIDVCSSRREVLEGLREDIMAPYADYQQWQIGELPPAITELLRSYAATRARPDVVFYLEDVLAGGGGFPNLPRYMKAMVRNELWVTVVEEDPGGGYKLTLVLHLLPWVDEDEAVAELLPGGLPGLATAVEHAPPPQGVDKLVEGDFQTIAELVEETHPEFHHGPLLIPWSATDARFFRAAGVTSYGFSPFLILTSDSHKITGPNERMVLPAFVTGVDLYTELVRRLAASAPPGDN